MSLNNLLKHIKRQPQRKTVSKLQNTNVTVNLISANGHFDNLCLFSADKIEKLGRPKTKRCLKADREQITKTDLNRKPKLVKDRALHEGDIPQF